MKAIGLVFLRLLGAGLFLAGAAGAVLIGLLSGLGGGYADLSDFLIAMGMSLGLFGPVMVVGIHWALFPLTWTRERARIMRIILWVLVAVPSSVFILAGFLGADGNDVAGYLVIFALAGGIGTVCVQGNGHTGTGASPT